LLLVLVVTIGGYLYFKRLGDTLSLALDRQEMAQVRSLLKRGASADTRSPRGNTALIWASVWPDVALVNELLDRGADINARNKNGSTALMAAAGWGQVEVVRALLSRGADPNLTDSGGRTAMAEAEKFLADAQAHTRSRPSARSRFLLQHAQKRVGEVIRLLNKHGATR
jgi:ankyrin repeat protein